jgi:mannose-6-phosphate isomerase
MIDLLECTVMPYAWGSRTAIASLTGRASPSDGPEAELWMGAHPVAPSKVKRTTSRSLAEVIAESAIRELGEGVAATFGERLPFLLKVLAAAQPLSLQAHPNEAQARAGFADEDQRGIPRDAPTRSYKDSSHKPELLCAIVPVDALCGFRRVADTLRLFDLLGVKELDEVIAPLRASPDAKGLKETFGAIMGLPAETAATIVRATVEACSRTRTRTRTVTEPITKASGSVERIRVVGPGFQRECEWAEKLEALYPGDVGVVSALLLNLVHLEPGEALYLDAGNLHAYLAGVGVEIMASSDNVLRGGLTKKHVDVPELMRVLDFKAGPAEPLRPRSIDEHERVWDTPAREFRLSAIDVDPGVTISRAVSGPEIVLSASGSATLLPGDGSPEVLLRQGASAFVGASTGHYELRSDGHASLYRATVNLT